MRKISAILKTLNTWHTKHPVFISTTWRHSTILWFFCRITFSLQQYDTTSNSCTKWLAKRAQWNDRMSRIGRHQMFIQLKLINTILRQGGLEVLKMTLLELSKCVNLQKKKIFLENKPDAMTQKKYKERHSGGTTGESDGNYLNSSTEKLPNMLWVRFATHTVQPFHSCTSRPGVSQWITMNTWMTHVACEWKSRSVVRSRTYSRIPAQETVWQSGVRSCIMLGQATHLVLELNAPTLYWIFYYHPNSA